jgi:hypothetical protein
MLFQYVTVPPAPGRGTVCALCSIKVTCAMRNLALTDVTVCQLLQLQDTGLAVVTDNAFHSVSPECTLWISNCPQCSIRSD